VLAFCGLFVCLFVFPFWSARRTFRSAQRSAIRRPRSQPASQQQPADGQAQAVRDDSAAQRAHSQPSSRTPLAHQPPPLADSQTAAADGTNSQRHFSFRPFVCHSLLGRGPSSSRQPPVRSSAPAIGSAAQISSRAEQGAQRSGTTAEERPDSQRSCQRRLLPLLPLRCSSPLRSLLFPSRRPVRRGNSAAKHTDGQHAHAADGARDGSDRSARFGRADG